MRRSHAASGMRSRGGAAFFAVHRQRMARTGDLLDRMRLGRVSGTPPVKRLPRPPWVEKDPSHRNLSARRTTTFVKPFAILCHLGPLRGRGMPPARRSLGAVIGCAPPQFYAIVEIVGHFKNAGAVHNVLKRKRPGRAIRTLVGEFAFGEFGGKDIFKLALHFCNIPIFWHRIASGLARYTVREIAYDVDCNQ